MHRIQKIEDRCVVYDKSPLVLDDGIENTNPIESWKFGQVGDPYYVLVMKAEKHLRNGFRYIKELLLQGHNHKLMQAFDRGVGTTRVSKTEDLIFPFDDIKVKESVNIPVSNSSANALPVINEWDVNKLCDLFEKHRWVMLRAVYTGSGKSFACKAMEQRGHQVLFVCPTNKLVQNNRESG